MRSTRTSLICALAAVLILVAAPVCPAPPESKESLVYFGTYTTMKAPRDSKGIYVSRFRSDTGDVTEPILAVETDNPSFLAVHPNRRFLYSTNETGTNSGVSAFSIDRTSGKLTLLNRVSSGGRGPCHIAVDRTGKFVMVANFTSGNAVVLQLKEDGSLGDQAAIVQQTGTSVNPQWQTASHAHWVGFSPDNRFALVANIGNDQLFVYRFNEANGSLTPAEPASIKVKPGDGPRNLTFHPNGKFAYLLSQLSGALNVYQWDTDRGVLNKVQETSVWPRPKGDAEDFNAAEVVVEPNGKFLYASNRGSDTVAAFSVDPAKGTLTLIQQESSRGISPRHISLDPTSSFLLVSNENTDGVTILPIDKATGRLRRLRKYVRLNEPVCAQFVTLD
jgi:6-phosphogluconolactonase